MPLGAADENGFRKVHYKKKKSVAAKKRLPPFHVDIVDINQFTCRLKALVEKFEKTDDVKRFLKSLREISARRTNQTINAIVCYGLGNFTSTVQSRNQLALLIILTSALKSKARVYDPVLSASEMQILETLLIEVLQINEEAKRTVSTQTLFFMPHCPHPLFNNLLWANWDAQRLSKLVIIGNSFSHIVNDLPKETAAEFYYLQKAVEFMEESPIPDGFCDAIYSTSIHSTDMEKLPSQDIGLTRTEPKYSDCNSLDMCYAELQLERCKLK